MGATRRLVALPPIVGRYLLLATSNHAVPVAYFVLGRLHISAASSSSLHAAAAEAAAAAQLVAHLATASIDQ